MASMSDALEILVGDYIFRAQTFTQPTVMAVALLSAVADDDDTGNFDAETGTEVSVTPDYGYLRKDHPQAGGTNWGQTTGTISNATAITFATASGGAWTGPLLGIALCGSASRTTGPMYFHGALTDQTKTIGDGDTANFAIGAITIAFA